MEQKGHSVATISEKKNTRSDKGIEAECKVEGAYIDDALTLTETGYFHYLILLCGGMVYLACGFQNGLNAYILPSCKCDFNLTSAQMGLMNALFLAGGIASGYLNGVIADFLGRRLSIIIALLGDAVCSLLSIFAPNFIVLSSLRFTSGFLVGGPGALTFLYVSEYLPIARRPPYMLLTGLFWTVSWLLLPALAWVVMPASWPLNLPIPLSPWRLFIGMMTIPFVLAALFVWKMPETPSYLYAKGQTQDALEVLTDMYVRNTGRSSSTYPVKVLRDPPVVTESVPPSKSAALTAARAMKSQFGVLFTQPVLLRNLIGTFAVFCNMIPYYGLALWLPELLARFEAHYSLFPDRAVSMCQLMRTWPDEMAEVSARLNSTGEIDNFDSQASCYEAAVNGDVFLLTLLISSVTFVANVASAFVASKAGRKTLPVLLNFTACALIAGMFFVNSTFLVLVIASLFQAAMCIGNTALNGLLVDLFPSNVSALGVMTGVLAGRVGAAISNITIGALIDVQCEVLLCLLTLAAGVSGLLCCFFPPPFEQIQDNCKTNDGTPCQSRGAAVV